MCKRREAEDNRLTPDPGLPSSVFDRVGQHRPEQYTICACAQCYENHMSDELEQRCQFGEEQDLHSPEIPRIIHEMNHMPMSLLKHVFPTNELQVLLSLLCRIW